MLEPERFWLVDAIVPTEWGFDLAPSETALASRESRRAPADEFILRRSADWHISAAVERLRRGLGGR
jgi:hypothetical protein